MKPKSMRPKGERYLNAGFISGCFIGIFLGIAVTLCDFDDDLFGRRPDHHTHPRTIMDPRLSYRTKNIEVKRQLSRRYLFRIHRRPDALRKLYTYQLASGVAKSRNVESLPQSTNASRPAATPPIAAPLQTASASQRGSLARSCLAALALLSGLARCGLDRTP